MSTLTMPHERRQVAKMVSALAGVRPDEGMAAIGNDHTR